MHARRRLAPARVTSWVIDVGAGFVPERYWARMFSYHYGSSTSGTRLSPLFRRVYFPWVDPAGCSATRPSSHRDLVLKLEQLGHFKTASGMQADVDDDVVSVVVQHVIA